MAKFTVIHFCDPYLLFSDKNMFKLLLTLSYIIIFSKAYSLDSLLMIVLIQMVIRLEFYGNLSGKAKSLFRRSN